MTKKAYLGKMNAGRSKHPFYYQEFKRERFRRQAWTWFVRQFPLGGAVAEYGNG